MSNWKLASSVFFGGTSQIQAIKGRRVRTRVPLLNVNVFDPRNSMPEFFSLRAGDIGFIANHHPERLDLLLIAFPANSALTLTTLDNLMRTGQFKVAIVNKPTFTRQFEIEA